MATILLVFGIVQLLMGIMVYFVEKGKTLGGPLLAVIGIVFLGLSFFVTNTPPLGHVVPTELHLLK